MEQSNDRMGNQSAARKMRIAVSNHDDHDLTEVSQESEFSACMREVLRRFRPRFIIETGTYLGTGTTFAVAKAIRELHLDTAEFYSIEVNPENYIRARRNLEASGLDQSVRLLNGLSVPRAQLPNSRQIEEQFVTNIPFADVYVDHPEAQRSALYYRETDFPDVPDDLLGYCIRATGHQPDLVLLDSGGHMGNVEFNYVIDRVECKCIIALVDVFHVKHRRSLEQIENDPRFGILHLSPEKCGFCIATFDPGVVSAKSNAVKILYVRPDAIGDTLLSSPLLPEIAKRYPEATISVVCQERVAELYQACSYVQSVIAFDRAQAVQNESYRIQLATRVKAVGADLALCSVFSRETLTDWLVAASDAPERIGMVGDFSNQRPEEKVQTNQFYTHLIASRGAGGNEIDHHRDFLEGLGLKASAIGAMVWTTDLDEAFADDYFHKERLVGNKVLAFFPGAQYDMRIYGGYRPVLEQLISEGWRILAFGSGNEFALCAGICEGLPACTNLCGTISIRQVAALMRRCTLGLGAESGLSHLCTATGLRHAVVLGGGHFGRFSPTSPLTTAAVLPLSCYGCNWQCRYTRPHCVKDLHPNLLKTAVVLAQERSNLPRVIAQASGFRPEVEGPQLKRIEPYLNTDRVALVDLHPEEQTI